MLHLQNEVLEIDIVLLSVGEVEGDRIGSYRKGVIFTCDGNLS